MKTLQNNTNFTLEGDKFGKYKLIDLAIDYPEFEEISSLKQIRLMAYKYPTMILAKYPETNEINIELKDKEIFYFQGNQYVVLVINTEKHNTSDNVRILKL